MALGAARYDMARFGFEVARASPRQADMIMAVSYTHLDVYKRQIFPTTSESISHYD